MRLEELSAVWDVVSANPLTLLFGAGWGAGFASPAVADIHVQFTHSLVSGMLLKTGLVGLFLSLFYLCALSLRLFQLRLGVVWPLAIMAPVLIDVFLYASYKSLDFGLVLLVIVALESYARQSRLQKSQNIEASSDLR